MILLEICKSSCPENDTFYCCRMYTYFGGSWTDSGNTLCTAFDVVDKGNFGILIAGGGGVVIGVTLLVAECTDGDLFDMVTGGLFILDEECEDLDVEGVLDEPET